MVERGVLYDGGYMVGCEVLRNGVYVRSARAGCGGCAGVTNLRAWTVRAPYGTRLRARDSLYGVPDRVVCGACGWHGARGADMAVPRQDTSVTTVA